MLTFSFVKNSAQAATYYEETDDYYAKEGQRGEWDGNGAAALGLQGGVDREVFKELLEGRLPDGRQVRKRAPKSNGGKKVSPRLGIDFTFSAPKSVSIVALVGDDRRVIEAHNEAVKDALKMMESKVVARQKVKGISFREHTNNLVIAKFQHDLSRDQDPQLHTHAIAMNLTQRQDQRWSAIANEEMLKGVKVVGAYYRAQLAERLQDMGYEVRRTRDGFEMASVSDAAIHMFSKRSRAIVGQLDAQGLTRDSATGGIKQTIAKNTRKRKDEGDRIALRKEWRDALAQAGIDIPMRQPVTPRAPGPASGSLDAGAAESGSAPNTSDNPSTDNSTSTRADQAEVAPAPPNLAQGGSNSAVHRTDEPAVTPRDGAQRPRDAAQPAESRPGTAGGTGGDSVRPDQPNTGTTVPPSQGGAGGGSAVREPDEQAKLDAQRPRGVPEPAEQPPEQTNGAARPATTPPATADSRGAAEPDAKKVLAAREALDFAIDHLTERQGIFTESELLERAYLHALAGVSAIDGELVRAKAEGRLVPELPLYQTAKSFSREEQAKALDKQFDKFRHDNDLHKLTRQSWISMLVNVEGYSQARAEKTVDNGIASGRLVATEERYTTAAMRERELRILWMEKLGRGTVVPIKTPEAVDAMLAETDLNAGQRQAAKLVLTTENRIVGVQGFAGVGKSHMLSKAVDAIKTETAKQATENGFKVIGLAPYGSQNKALKELGMESKTLALFLVKEPAPGELGPKTIIFLDEASVVPAHQMEILIQRVEQAGARLVLLGDRKQTQAVEAGKPFEQLQDAGMQLAHITEIQRQKENPILLAAVERAATDNVGGSLSLVAENTREIEEPLERYEAIAKEYAALSVDERNNTLIVVGTNDARRNINDLVRGKLGLPAGEHIAALESYDMSRAEHRHAYGYKEGVILVAESDGPHGLKRGEQYQVVKINDAQNTLELTNKESGIVTVNASTLTGVSTYRLADIELVKDDWIRVTRNDNKQGIFNGERHQVATVEADAVVLANGARLSRDNPIHAQHGYAQTVHSAQGLTTNRVLMDADTRSLTSNRSVYYVAISRARKYLSLYTDDKTRLTETMSREPKKYAALEIRDSQRESEVLTAASMLRRQNKEHQGARQTLSAQIAKPTQGPKQATARRNRTR